jgi:GNAT superfamily N-acetyltransferase
VAGDLVIRTARPSDARGIAEVSVASRRWSYRDLLSAAELERLSVEEAEAVFARGLAELRSTSAVFVAERDGQIVGYSNVQTSSDPDIPAGTSEVGGLYVTEDVAGTGVAWALMGRTVDRARTAGQNLLTLWVRRENGRARRFYEKYGFEIDSAERSSSHPALRIEIHEVRYRMPLREAD